MDDEVKKWIEDNNGSEYCNYCIWGYDCNGKTECRDGIVSEPPCCSGISPKDFLELEAILMDLEKGELKV